MADKMNSITVDGGFGHKNSNKNETKVSLLSIKGTVLFPFALTPLIIDGQDNVQMITRASNDNRIIGFFPELSQDAQPQSQEHPKHIFETADFFGTNISKIGVLARIVKVLNFPDGTVRVLLRGLKRISINSSICDEASHKYGVIKEIVDETDNSIETAAMAKNAINQFQELISISPHFPDELKVAIFNVGDNVRMVDLIADTLNISFEEKLSILTSSSLRERLQILTVLLNRELEVLHLGSDIQSQVHNAVSKSQREYFLREQLKTIQKELGNNSNPDIAAIEERLKTITLPDSVLRGIKKELERLDVIPPSSPEYHVAYNYIDWLISIPWQQFTKDQLDIDAAAKILDQDHYGLKDVKERILEFLSVLKLKQDGKAPILCFVGPPGVGKTSLGQSIAKAMQRKFVRFSLGGIKDEAELRGHRRTYVGAMPGRIIQGLKKAGSTNPVFMLDEIDKLGRDYRGDPASAMLEVLDPQQNKTFNDHFIEYDFDLSSVLFIATANMTDTIPSALLDRMEIIQLSGYTFDEKKHIARKFLLPKQIKENGLKLKNIVFSAEAIDDIIHYYTREAGVRSLERTIAGICRKLARKIVQKELDEKNITKIDTKMVVKLLGQHKYDKDTNQEIPQVGVANGLAWTSVGGTVLPVEIAVMPGHGKLKMTGNLGDVMKESVEAALSFIRANSKKYKISDAIFSKSDLHIHIPDAATPKDGPSAGITITVAIISALTNRPVRNDFAMTGEITIRGKVKPVGGIKEKVLAALTAGCTSVILPDSNRKNLEDIPNNLKNKLQFHFVSQIDQAVELCLNTTKNCKKI